MNIVILFKLKYIKYRCGVNTATCFFFDALLLRLCRGVSLLRLGMKMQQYLDQMFAQPGAFKVMSYPKTLLLRLVMKKKRVAVLTPHPNIL